MMVIVLPDGWEETPESQIAMRAWPDVTIKKIVVSLPSVKRVEATSTIVLSTPLRVVAQMTTTILITLPTHVTAGSHVAEQAAIVMLAEVEMHVAGLAFQIQPNARALP